MKCTSGCHWHKIKDAISTVSKAKADRHSEGHMHAQDSGVQPFWDVFDTLSG